MPDIETPQVEILGLSKTFKRRHGAGDVKPIDDVTLRVNAGELVVLLGPSGCGKTTLLRSVAGLERPDAGRIRIQGEDVFDASSRLFLPPNKRPISMIFQSYALWPHMTVFQNVAYPITSRRRRVSKSEIADAVHRSLERVGLRDLHGQYPGQLSGGQQQRVALARALVTDAKVLLFDEPLSNVDAKVREELRAQLIEMQRELGFTALYVTHDQDEAMDLAHRIAVLDSGKIAQLAPPREVYAAPASRYVAEFVGSANLLDGVVEAVRGGMLTVRTELGTAVAGEHSGDEARTPGVNATVMFRPEDLQVSTAGAPTAQNSWAATVIRTSFFGNAQTVSLKIGDTRLTAALPHYAVFADGDEVCVSVAPEHVRVLPTEGTKEASAS